MQLAVMCFCWWQRRRRIAALLAGMLWVALAAPAAQPPALIAGQPTSVAVTVIGRIDSIPKYDGDKAVFQLRVSEIPGHRTQELPLRLRLSWYKAPADLRRGQLWHMTVRLKPARGRFNRSGFDYERWLYVQGIQAVGYVYRGDSAQLLAAQPANPLQWMQNAFASHLRDLLPAQAPGVLRAVLAGDKSALSPQLRALYRDSGTAHVLVVSGLHITLMAGLGFVLGQWVWPLLALRRPGRQRFAVLVSFAAASVYAALAGFTVPVTRAWLMLLVWTGCRLLRRHVPPLQILQLALLLVLLAEPRAPLDSGFWLSFFAVWVIIMMRPLDRFSPLWLQVVPWQWRMTLLTLPLMLLIFQRFSPLSVLANLLVVPVYSLLIVPGGFLAVALGALWEAAGQWLMGELVAVVRGVSDLLALLLALPGALWQSPAVTPLAAAAGLLGAMLMLTPASLHLRALTPVFFLLLFMPRLPGVPEGQARITVLDVGQGLSVLVETRRYSLLYDTGAYLSRRLTVARGLVVPFLHARGLDSLDSLLVSHPDSDHAAGYADLLADLPVREVIANPAFAGNFRRIDRPCRHGRSWQRDGVRFRLLLADLPADATENDRSCLLEVSAGGERLLLSGDVEAPAEAALLGSGALRPVSYLVAPHHGSGSSSTAGFIARLRPQHVIYTVGYRNRWGFPTAQVVARYEAAGAQHWRTDRDGCVSIALGSAAGPAVRACRDAHVRFWRPPFDL
ncbi:DNA internalization-related competence protein ComEC/Rec2 [Granulosicoccaceae sp. 1_MG-2023]|nr:DNA internalization-related competence protein ComEC/Rec2 [Granulosicoccaceae sp. 1_MG-2023]